MILRIIPSFFVVQIDDDFIAMYQANYGFTASGEHDPNVNVQPEPASDTNANDKKSTTETKKDNNKTSESAAGKKRKAEEKAEWFDIDEKRNTNVYVSGLPETTTEEEFQALMSKCGIIMMDDKGIEK